MIVFIMSPWFHKLIYSNLLAAWPTLGSDRAHGIGLVGTGIVFAVTLLWRFAP